MINHDNLYDDLKILFLSCGYLTEDESCGYDELMFAVRKDYLFDNIKGEEIKNFDDMERWLREEYTSDDTNWLYQKAKFEKEIVFEKPIWDTRRAVFYEVGEGLRSSGEIEEMVYIRTFDYDTAKRAFEAERDKLLADEDFFLKDEEPNEEQCFDFGYALIRYENEDGDFYELYLHQVEVEVEAREYK